MKELNLIALVFFFFFSCSQDNQPNASNNEWAQKTEIEVNKRSEDKKENVPPESEGSDQLRRFQDSIMLVPKKSIMDYYYLLPSKPYFAMEVGKDNVESRKAGLEYQHVKNGYIVL